MIFGSEVRREQSQSGQVDLSRAQGRGHGRQSPRGARHHDPAVRGVLGESEFVDAVREHGGKGAFQEELALVDLAQMHKEVRLDAVSLIDQLARSGEELGVAEQSNGFE